MRTLVLLWCAVVISAVLPAQEVLFPVDKGQLEFHSTLTLHQPMLVEGPGDFVQGLPTLSGIMGIQHRFSLPHQFGVAVGGELGIVPFNWSYNMSFINDGSEATFRIPVGPEYFSGFQMSLPLSLSKRVTLSNRSRLRLGLDGLLHFYPFTINNEGLGYSAGRMEEDTSRVVVMRGDVRPTTPPYALAARASVGYEWVTKRQNTLGMELMVHLSDHILHQGNVVDLTTNGPSERYALTHSINYVGLRFRYGFTYRPDPIGPQVIGPTEEVEANEQSKGGDLGSKYWLSASTGFHDLHERTVDPHGFYDAAYFPSGTHGFTLESHDSINWRLGVDYFPLWVVSAYSKHLGVGQHAGGTDPLINLHAAVGKDVIQSPGKKLGIKAWAGIGSYINLSVPYLGSDGVIGMSSGGFYSSGDTIIYDTVTTYAHNLVVPYVRTGLEFDVRVLRRLQLAVLPSYTFGFMRLYESEVTYFAPEVGWNEAQVFTRGSGFALRFQLKFPIDFLIPQGRSDD